jgi:hypothetical protein
MATAPQGAPFYSPFIAGTLAAAGQVIDARPGTPTPSDGRGLFLEFGRGSVSLSGTFSVTRVSLQKRRDDEDISTGWKTVYVYNPATTDPREFRIFDCAPAYYRLTVEAGNYSDGPVSGRIDAQK